MLLALNIAVIALGIVGADQKVWKWSQLVRDRSAAGWRVGPGATFRPARRGERTFLRYLFERAGYRMVSPYLYRSPWGDLLLDGFDPWKRVGYRVTFADRGRQNGEIYSYSIPYTLCPHQVVG